MEQHLHMKQAKKENYEVIYHNEAVNQEYNDILQPMFREVYERLLDDLQFENENSLIYRHHIAFIEGQRRYYSGPDYMAEDPNQIVVDFIASMTDDYFIALHEFLFPDSPHRIQYHSYFEDFK